MIWLLRSLVFLSVFWASVGAHATSLSLTNAGGSGGSAAVVSLCSNVGAGASSTITCTTNQEVATGNTIVVLIGDQTALGVDQIVSVTDTASNTYSSLRKVNAAQVQAGIYYVLNPTGMAAGSTITVTFLGAQTARYVQAYMMPRTMALGQSATATATSTTPSCSISDAPGRVLVGTVNALGTGDTIAQPAGWTAGLTNNSNGGYEQTSGSDLGADVASIAYNPTGYSSVLWACAVAGFDATPLTATLLCTGVSSTNNQTVTCSTNASIPAGVGIVVVSSAFGASDTISSVGDGSANVYAQANAQTSALADTFLHYSQNTALLAASATVTVTWTSNIAAKWMAVYKLNRAAATIPTIGSATGISATPSCNLSSNSGSLIFGSVNVSAGVTAGTLAGWTLDYNQAYVGTAVETLGQKLNGGAGTVTFNPTGYTSSQWVCTITEVQ